MKRLIGFPLLVIDIAAFGRSPLWSVAPVQAKDTQGDPSKYVGAWTGDVTLTGGIESTPVDLTLFYENTSVMNFDEQAR